MIRILIATALLIAAFSVNAFATDLSVTVTVGAIRTINYNGGSAGDVTFTITDADLTDGEAVSGNPDDFVTYAANTNADVTFDSTGEGGLTLSVNGSVGGAGVANFADNAEIVDSNTALGNKNTAALGFDITSYQINNLSWATAPADYNFTATFTIGATD